MVASKMHHWGVLLLEGLCLRPLLLYFLYLLFFVLSIAEEKIWNKIMLNNVKKKINNHPRRRVILLVIVIAIILLILIFLRIAHSIQLRRQTNAHLLPLVNLIK